MKSERSSEDDAMARTRSRAAEALEGDGAVFDAANAQHRAALLLLLGDNTEAAPPSVDELVQWTGFPQAFVKRVVRRFDAGGCRTRFSTYVAFELPGPCLDTVHDVQVGLGLALRHEDALHVWYEFTPKARENIEELQCRWSTPVPTAKASPAACGTHRGEVAPAIDGTLRLPRKSDSSKVRVGSRLILRPSTTAADLRPGAYARLVSDQLTAWLKIEGALGNPRRLIVRLLGVSSEPYSEHALAALRETFEEDGDLCSAGAPSTDSSPAYAH